MCAAASYTEARVRRMPPWTIALMCLSLRLHSVYLLRLFNDCWAMLLAWAALLLFAKGRWRAGCVCYSLGVGVKMNVLLFAPGLALLLLKVHGPLGAAAHIALCAAVQLALGAPFLAANPLGYMLRAFGGFGDLNQKWSVNWKVRAPAARRHGHATACELAPDFARLTGPDAAAGALRPSRLHARAARGAPLGLTPALRRNYRPLNTDGPLSAAGDWPARLAPLVRG